MKTPKPKPMTEAEIKASPIYDAMNQTRDAYNLLRCVEIRHDCPFRYIARQLRRAIDTAPETDRSEYHEKLCATLETAAQFIETSGELVDVMHRDDPDALLSPAEAVFIAKGDTLPTDGEA